MRSTFPPEQVRAAAEKALKDQGHKGPYEYVNEEKVLAGEEMGNFVYCLQYKIRRSSTRTLYIVLMVDVSQVNDELEGQVLFKRSNVEFTASELLFSLYR